MAGSMRKPIAIDVAACDRTMLVAREANRGLEIVHRVWHKFLRRHGPAVFSMLAIGCTASSASAFGADGGSYRTAVKDVRQVYQAVTSNPYYRITRELDRIYGRYEKGLDGVIAAMNGQPLPAIGDGNFDDDLAELEKKVDALKMPDLQPIPAFPIGILGLSRDALRQEIRAGVGFVFAARSGAAAGSGFIDSLPGRAGQYQQFRRSYPEVRGVT